MSLSVSRRRLLFLDSTPMHSYHIRIAFHLSSISSVSSSSYQPPSTLRSSYIPKSLFEPLPSHSPKSTARRSTLVSDTSCLEHKDYRFGSIRVDWVDNVSMAMITGTYSKVGGGKEKEKDARRGEPFIAKFKPNSLTDSTQQRSGSTILPEGTVHIYRDASRPPETTRGSPALTTPKEANNSQPGDHNSPGTEDDYTVVDHSSDGAILAVLAVPSWMTPADFLAFVAPAVDGIALLRMIRDSAPNRSIVVMKFRQTSDAAEFAEAYNGKPFNSMEPEICHVVRVSTVSIDSDDLASQGMSRLSLSLDSGSVYELPTCPVCLERMDAAVTGLVTVPCSHTFHCACLSKWGDSRCPVCRYSQTLLSSHPPSSNGAHPRRSVPFSLQPNASCCMDCGSTANLWICLICGNVGCGRYGRAHAHAHYTHTTHLYALELETQRVWDYAGDGYVHRLIQNKADGKLVELPSSAIGSNGSRGDGDSVGPSAADALSAEKIEAIGIEYSYLLTSQLDSQRAFYEEQTTELRTQLSELRVMVEQLSAEYDKTKTGVAERERKAVEKEKARSAQLGAELSKMQGRMQKTQELAQKLTKELRDERAVSKGLMENLQKAKHEAEQVQQEKARSAAKVQELEDQLRDVMFFLDAKSGIESGKGPIAEAAGGSIALPAPSPAKRR